MCRLMAAIARRARTSIMHDTVTDPDIRLKLRRSMGFCHKHTWGLPDAGAGARLGVAIIYHDFLEQVNKKLDQASFQPSGGISLRRARESLSRKQPAAATEAIVRALEPQDPCPACLHHAELEAISTITLVEMIGKEDERMLTALRNSVGLCLPHLRRALELSRDEATFRRFISLTTETITQLQTELAEFRRKNDHRHLDEKLTPEESNSWKRALSLVVGASERKIT